MQKAVDNKAQVFVSIYHNATADSSVHSFPDSYLAGEAHRYRSRILMIQSRLEEAQMEIERVRQYFTDLLPPHNKR